VKSAPVAGTIAVLVLLGLVPALEAQGPATSPGSSASGDAQSGAAKSVLRERFYGRIGQPAQGAQIVGRLGLILVGELESRQVGLDHDFRSGDKVRFAVSSNHDGWLYIFHSGGTGLPKQVWPRTDVEGQPFPVCAKKEYLIPPAPGVFQFGGHAGAESLYVAIMRGPSPPVAHASGIRLEGGKNGTPGDVDVCAESQKRKIANFVVRDPLAGKGGGFVYVPGDGQSDLYSYFTSPEAGQSGGAAIAFRLRHAR